MHDNVSWVIWVVSVTVISVISVTVSGELVGKIGI